jgi:hypothetical protein
VCLFLSVSLIEKAKQLEQQVDTKVRENILESLFCVRYSFIVWLLRMNVRERKYQKTGEFCSRFFSLPTLTQTEKTKNKRRRNCHKQEEGNPLLLNKFIIFAREQKVHPADVHAVILTTKGDLNILFLHSSAALN